MYPLNLTDSYRLAQADVDLANLTPGRPPFGVHLEKGR